MATHTTIDLLGLDWGTTHRRAYALDAAGQCQLEHADDQGALACQGRFPEALADLLQQLQLRPRAIVLSGMVGSALGWQVVPYVDGAVALGALGRHLQPVAYPGDAVDVGDAADATAPPPVAIVPGYCVRDAQGQPDVMRGEETQLLGAHCLGHSDGWFVLPGTHSKWVELRAGHVAQLRTFMTGELFDLLGRHGTLAAAGGQAAPVWDAAAFANGVLAAQAGGALSQQLFACRARVVCGDMPATSSRAYLSGLLIGTELHAVRHGHGAASGEAGFKLLGSPALAAHYERAAAQLGMRLEVLDARAAFIAALHHLNPNRATP